MTHDSSKQNQRILAIDILRGITIAGMILVNNPGSWAHMFAPLEHAEWNGMTPTDLVFPFFMFVMGMCIFISMQKFDFACNRTTVYKIIKRALLLYLIGIAIGWFSRFCYRWAYPLEDATFGEQLWYSVWTFDKARLTGVLARLAVCYGITALLGVSVRHKYLPHIAVTILIGYTLLLFFGNGFAYNETNILAIVDKAVLSDAHMYHDNGIDPEGLLSTLPAIAHTLIGFLVGRMLFRKDQQPLSSNPQSQILLSKVVPLFVTGAILTFSGLLLSYGCPLNKKIWSPTYVLASCGLASTLLALLIWIIDIKGHRNWCTFFAVFGMNPLFLFVMSGVIAIVFGSFQFPFGAEPTSITGFLYRDLYAPLFGANLGSLAHALTILALLWLIGYPLYKKRIYIKL